MADLKRGRRVWWKALLLLAFVIITILGVNEYPTIEVLVRIICTSCIGLSG